MSTLQKWRFLLEPLPRKLAFPKMELIGRDHEQTVLAGRGEVYQQTLASIEFKITGRPADPGFTLKKFSEAQKNPYDIHAQFRLTGVDENGTEWACGWTTPSIDRMGDSEWKLSGELRGLTTEDRSSTVSAESGVEVIYVLPAGHPIIGTIASVTRWDPSKQKKEHVFEVLGTPVTFAYEPENRILTISGAVSDALQHPYVENWVSEPLRIMFGQLVFPRLLARNFGEGRAMIALRPTPNYFRSAHLVSLWHSGVVGQDTQAFWDLYGRLFTMIAKARDGDGHQNFESNKITQFYEEIIQATRGSRWVWVLTLASVIEGLVKMLVGPNEKRRDIDHAAVGALVAHINDWEGTCEIKKLAIDAFRQRTNISAASELKALRNRGVLTSKQVAAWSKLRHSVMHGNLVAPWSTKAEDDAILDLFDLMHRLTREVIAAAA